jgi:hypothetical protein
MSNEVDFEQVLKLFESYGWRLEKIYEPYRVFVKEGQLPWLIPVKNRKVDIEYVQKFKKFVEEQGRD